MKTPLRGLARRHARALPVLAALALGLVAVGCGDDSSSSSGSDTGSKGATGTEEVSVALSPFQDVYSMFIGVDNGWYDEQGIKLDFVETEWADAQTAISGGQVDLANSADADVLTARAEGRDVVLALPLYLFAANLILVRDDAPFTTYDEFVEQGQSREEALRSTMEQLEGKDVCLPASGANQSAFASYAKAAGYDYKKDFKLTTVPETEAAAAFIRGSCDALMSGVPQLIQSLQRGGKVLLPQGALPETVAEAGFSTSQEYATQSMATLRKIAKIMFRQQQLIKQDPDAGLGTISQHLKEAGTPLEVDQLKEIWGQLELFPASADEVWRDWICEDGDYYWKDRWEAAQQGLLDTGVIKEEIDVRDGFIVDEVLEPLVSEEAKACK